MGTEMLTNESAALVPISPTRAGISPGFPDRAPEDVAATAAYEETPRGDGAIMHRCAECHRGIIAMQVLGRVVVPGRPHRSPLCAVDWMIVGLLSI